MATGVDVIMEFLQNVGSFILWNQFLIFIRFKNEIFEFMRYMNENFVVYYPESLIT